VTRTGRADEAVGTGDHDATTVRGATPTRAPAVKTGDHDATTVRSATPTRAPAVRTDDHDATTVRSATPTRIPAVRTDDHSATTVRSAIPIRVPTAGAVRTDAHRLDPMPRQSLAPDACARSEHTAKPPLPPSLRTSNPSH
jgi:hypothetical protein